jgi:hypothetical protein
MPNLWQSKTFFEKGKSIISMSGTKHQSTNDVPLVPINDFKQAVKKVLSNTKAESDKQLAELQISNLKKRQAKKHR